MVRMLPKLMNAFTWSKMPPRMNRSPTALATTTAAGHESFTPNSESNRFDTAFAPPMEFDVSTFICDRQMMGEPHPAGRQHERHARVRDGRVRRARGVVAHRGEVRDRLLEAEVRDERAEQVRDHGEEAAHQRDGHEVALAAREAREVGREERQQARGHDGVVHPVGEPLAHLHAGDEHPVRERIAHLAVRGHEVHHVAHDGKQRHHEHGVHARDGLRAERAP